MAEFDKDFFGIGVFSEDAPARIKKLDMREILLFSFLFSKV